MKHHFLILKLMSLLIAAALLFVGCAGTGSENETTATADESGSESEAVTTVSADETTASSDDTGYDALKYSGELLSTQRVSVHDPSIVYNTENGRYYVFGSHRAWAMSKNLASWVTFSLALDSTYEDVLAEAAAWASNGSSSYDVSGNMWAPDVIYNEAMGKWCMYMSVNGDNYYSSIVLLTADSINGKYEYVGAIVYSGFTNKSEASETDFYDVVESKSEITRYISNGSWNSSYGPNAIDPCVFYDENGDLWMSYGSWFGGIFLLKLDNETGLRDYTYTYEYEMSVSDPYLGYHISGGYGASGEGSYIVWDKDAGYYYLYVSYCGLDATDSFSGYHIRLFRSETVNGPYYDSAGNTAVVTSSTESQTRKGIKLFGNYYFSSLKGNGENSRSGYMSGGHNSAFIDSDGQHYLVYHTRFNLGNEWHELRVHQQFMNEDGWPVTAVYEFLGSVISEDGYDTDEIVGTYEYVNHGTSATTAYTDILETLTVTLNADGTITGDVEGTWDEHTGDDGLGYYCTFVIGSHTYKGVFFKQYDESKNNVETMTFTLIGDNDTAIWGSKVSD
ncbi:MAG: glycoside hydrolase family 43 protein [Clostridiales bacterium]|nr:glycoside hydrolase family 43 protein [Clostridiales bacterium]